MENNADGLMNRAEIDTSAPFASVKEAVMIFGEKVLVKELYANMITQMRTTNMNVDNHSIQGHSNAEVDEAKNKLNKSHQDNKIIENRLSYLEEELEKTKTELIRIKAKEANKQFIESDIEQLKFVENESEVDIKINDSRITNTNRAELQKKRSVKFADPPIMTHIRNIHEHVPERQYFVNTESMHEKERKRKSQKKKRLMPLLAAIFYKKKNNDDGVAYA